MRCTSTYHYYDHGGERMTVFQCTLDAPHDREPQWGLAAIGCHRDEGSGHFWDDASSHEAVRFEMARHGWVEGTPTIGPDGIPHRVETVAGFYRCLPDCQAHGAVSR